MPFDEHMYIVFFGFFFINLFTYLFIYFWLCWVFVYVRGPSPVAASRGHWASHYRGLSRCGAQAPDAQAQQLWLTGPVALRHAGSPQTRARTRVPCIGRQTPNHCATREALYIVLLGLYLGVELLGNRIFIYMIIFNRYCQRVSKVVVPICTPTSSV